MRSIGLGLLMGGVLGAAASAAAAEDSAVATAQTSGNQVLEEVVVTATLRQQSLLSAPASITVLGERSLRDAGRQHLEDVFSSIPNLHWAAGTSRPRFLQIRGIGELEQYEGAPNPSVGFLIDDIDFSGIGMPATTFDVERVEVLRGPQGTRYGANALAGLVVMRGAAPSEEFAFRTEASYGEYESESLGAVLTGPVESLDSTWRIAVQRYRTDGFRSNSYLHRDDTNGRDELTGRFKWRWQPSADTRVDLTWLHANLDDNYDAWSIDNTRRSLSDHPGKDAQRSNGASLRVQTAATEGSNLTVIASAADTDAEHSYDGDWGNAESWAPFTYDYFYRALRDRRTRSLEARLSSRDAPQPGTMGWLTGVYAMNLSESIHERNLGVYAAPEDPEPFASDDALSSHYDATNFALFGQLDGRWTDRWSWSAGARAEQRNADYRDSGTAAGNARATAESARDRMWGGQLSLAYEISEGRNAFASLSRGYKAGGFNLGTAAQAQGRFVRESLTSAELGLKSRSRDGAFYWDMSAFYMLREHPQVKTGEQLQVGDPNSFVIFTVNAERGANYGLEASARWRATDALELGMTAGLLRTYLEGYEFEGVPVAKREQPHAPEYQVSMNATWRHPSGWMARVDVSAIDGFYFDVPPNPTRAKAYTLAHLKAGFEADNWSVYVWARNVFDEEYATRGFFFGNEPPAFENKRYIQLGEPRQIGLTARWGF